MRSKAKTMADRFRLYGKSYFEFITTPEIDPTNKLAERAIRLVVIDRNVTQGTRSAGDKSGASESGKPYLYFACALEFDSEPFIVGRFVRLERPSARSGAWRKP